MEEINCPICNQNNTEVIFKKGNLDKDLINVICKNCALVYINPRKSKEEYDDFHKEEFLSEKLITNIGQVKQKLNRSDFKIKTSIFNFLDEYLEGGQNVLDVGCGFGALLDIIKKEKKTNVFGVELGNLDVMAAREYYGLELFHGSLQRFAGDQKNHGKFDIIIMHHILEHLPEPLISLGHIKQLLKQGGILYAGVPNIMNLRKRPEIFFQQAHPFSYSPHSLKLILEKSGFGIVKLNKHAGYPGGMEVIAKPDMQDIANIALEEGSFYGEAIDYVNKKKNTFAVLRSIRDEALFYIPKKWRIGLGRIFYKILKNR